MLGGFKKSKYLKMVLAIKINFMCCNMLQISPQSCKSINFNFTRQIFVVCHHRMAVTKYVSFLMWAKQFYQKLLWTIILVSRIMNYILKWTNALIFSKNTASTLSIVNQNLHSRKTNIPAKPSIKKLRMVLYTYHFL